jgi:hypothetical protein
VLWHCAVFWLYANISEERIASIFRAENVGILSKYYMAQQSRTPPSVIPDTGSKSDSAESGLICPCAPLVHHNDEC